MALQQSKCETRHASLSQEPIYATIHSHCFFSVVLGTFLVSTASRDICYQPTVDQPTDRRSMSASSVSSRVSRAAYGVRHGRREHNVKHRHTKAHQLCRGQQLSQNTISAARSQPQALGINLVLLASLHRGEHVVIVALL